MFYIVKLVLILGTSVYSGIRLLLRFALYVDTTFMDLYMKCALHLHELRCVMYAVQGTPRITHIVNF